MSPHPWTVKVHKEMLASGAKLSVWQITELFGTPEGRQRASDRLHASMMLGWFDASLGIDGNYVYTARHRAQKRGAWPDEQRKLLAEVWPTMGIDCAPMFPDSTPRGVRSMAEKLKLRRVKAVTAKKPATKKARKPVEEVPLSRDGLPRVVSIFSLAEAL